MSEMSLERNGILFLSSVGFIPINPETAALRYQRATAPRAVRLAEDVQVSDLALKSEWNIRTMNCIEGLLGKEGIHRRERKKQSVPGSQNRRRNRWRFDCMGIGDAYPKLRCYLIGACSAAILECQSECGGRQEHDGRADARRVGLNAIEGQISSLCKMQGLAGEFGSLLRESVRFPSKPQAAIHNFCLSGHYRSLLSHYSGLALQHEYLEKSSKDQADGEDNHPPVSSYFCVMSVVCLGGFATL